MKQTPATAEPKPAKDRTIVFNPQPIKVGPFTIPPLNIRTAVLLERIDSPFMVPSFDLNTGKSVPRIPKISDISKAAYIFVHADDDGIEDLIDDEKAFNKAFLDFCRQIAFQDLRKLGDAVRQTVQAVNDSAEAAGLEGSNQGK